MNRICLFAFAALAVQTYAQNTEKEIVEFRTQSARAVGTFAPKGEWVFRGTQTIHGTQQPFMLSIDTSFRYLAKSNGTMPETLGFDGKSTWAMNGAGLPHVVSFSDRDLARLDMYVLSGLWAAKNSPVEITSVKGDTCEIKCVDGSTKATLTLDHTTRLPASLAYWGPQGTQKWVYSKFSKQNGLKIPTVIQRDSGDSHEKILIASSTFSTVPNSNYQIPKVDTSGFSYDAAISPDIEVKRIFGYLFVKPLINGKDEGWFFLDTGAEVMVLDPEIAKKNNAKTVGKEVVSGVVGSVTTDFVEGIEFQLGPATIRKSSYMLLDMTEFSKVLGVKLAGICGFDFIGRVSMDIDPAKATIGVHPSGKASLPKDAAWTQFLYHGNIPAITCMFEGDRQGVFSLDTGSGSTVDFFSPTVTKYELLKDRKVTSVQTGGAGGSAESKVGIMEWFTFGPKKFEKPRVGFQIADKGAFASPYADGNIGMGFMGKFRMILDYENSRLAFIEKAQ